MHYFTVKKEGIKPYPVFKNCWLINVVKYKLILIKVSHTKNKVKPKNMYSNTNLHCWFFTPNLHQT